MADDSELDKRAVEELLKEATRARARAETMGPAGWMKCPLHSTNKRFLLNTLRTSGVQQRRPPRGHQGEAELGSKSRGYSRASCDLRDDHRSHKDKRDSRHGDTYEDYGERGHGHDKHRDHDHHRDHDKHRDHYHRIKDSVPKTGRLHSEELPPQEGKSSPRKRSLSRDRSQSHYGVSSVCSPLSKHPREHSRSPIREMPSGRGHK